MYSMALFPLLRCLLLSASATAKEAYFLNGLAAYTTTALSSSEFALCYLRNEGMHGCKVVPLAPNVGKTELPKRLDFDSPEVNWGSSINEKDLLTRYVVDDLFILCAKPECYAVQRNGTAFTFSRPLAIDGKYLSLTLTRRLSDTEPGKVNLCTRTTNASVQNALFGIGVQCVDMDVTCCSPLKLAFTDPKTASAHAHLQASSDAAAQKRVA